MTAIRDRLTPPAPTRTPHDHFAIADLLAAELDAMQPHELTLPHGKSKMALAELHARLAQCVPPPTSVSSVVAKESGRPALGECKHCGGDIFRLPVGWIHLSGFRFTCLGPYGLEQSATPTEGN